MYKIIWAFKNIIILNLVCYNQNQHYGYIYVSTMHLGHVIGERKLHLVYGGGDWGLSKLVSKVAFTRGS